MTKRSSTKRAVMGSGHRNEKRKRLWVQGLALFLLCLYVGSSSLATFAKANPGNVPMVPAPLSGTYTIGGSAPDYNSFADAVNALVAEGVSGPVIFNVRTGTYQEQVTIPSITGSSATNTITFQSESGDSTEVVLEHSSGSSSNYTLKLDGAQWMTFRKMTLKAGHGTYVRVAELSEGADHNSFENNVIDANSGNAYAAIYSLASYNTFLKNKIYYGETGIELEGSSGNNDHNNSIRENTFTQQYKGACEIRYQEELQLISNTIGSSTALNASALYVSNCSNGLEIRGNKFSLSNGEAHGLRLNRYTGSATEKAVVANNFIQLGSGNSNQNALYLSNCSYVGIYHNSLHITSTETNARALSLHGGNNIELLNNIIANSGGGYALYANSTSNISLSDYNNFYTTGGTLTYRTGGGQPDLTAWQVASGFDANSLSVDPDFITATDLHMNTAISLFRAGTPLSAVTDDIDGETRDLSTPSIGADEVVPALADASIFALDTTFTEGTRPVYVTLRNYASTPLTSVQIHWEINGVTKTIFNWTGNLAPNQDVNVNLGTHSFNLATPYNFKIWTTLPNGVADENSNNDELVTNNHYIYLNGTYTIGGNQPHFANFTEAVTNLKDGGVAGPVTFQVRSATYQEQVIIPVIAGASAANTITFQSESEDSTEVILEYAANAAHNYTLKLDAAQWLRFRKMTIRAAHSIYTKVIELSTGANNNRFEHNIVDANSDTRASTIYSLGNNNSFIGNKVYYGKTGVEVKGSFANRISGTIIRGNTFEGQSQFACQLAYQDAPELSGNVINETAFTFNSKAVYLNNCKNFHILSNKIVANDMEHGFHIYNSIGSAATPSLIANNFVQAGSSREQSEVCLIYGSDYVNLYHNTIQITKNSEAAKTLMLTSSENVNLVNNILANEAGGYAIYLSSNSSLSTCDYNDLYSTGPVLAHWNGTDAADLTAWQTQSAMGTHSRSVAPFNRDGDVQPRQWKLKGAGIALSGINEDIEGDIRNASTPDIGADEFSLFANDLGVNALVAPLQGCQASEAVTLAIANYGSQAQNSFDVAYTLNGGQAVTESVNAMLPPGDTIHYTFPAPANMAAAGTYTIGAHTVLAGDQDPAGDAMSPVSINSLPILTASITGKDTICYGESLTLNAQGDAGTSYLWNDGSTQASLTVSPEVTTTYTVTLTNTNGCSVSKSLTVNVLPLPATVPVITAGGSITICEGDSVQLTSDMSNDILWSTGSNNASVYAKASGDYYVSYLNSAGNGCSVTSDTVKVVVVPSPVIQVNGVTTVCVGDAVTLSVPAGSSPLWSTGASTIDITVSPSVTTTYRVTANNSLGCPYTDSVTIAVIPPQSPTAVSNLLPSDGSLDMDIPLNLSWMPAGNASNYDVYVWADDQSKPATPTISNTTQIHHSYADLDYGKGYNWQVVAKNSCFETAGPVQHFAVRNLPDLTVSAVNVPASIASGAVLNLSWHIQNAGTGSSGSSVWRDVVALSVDDQLSNDDIFLTRGTTNISHLHGGQSYIQTQSYQLDPFVVGNYFLLVSVDDYKGFTPYVAADVVKESDEQNNSASAPIVIYPAPSPDLTVSSVGAPVAAFGNDTVTVTYIVSNSGVADAYGFNWVDQVYLSQDNSLSIVNNNIVTNAVLLGSVTRADTLAAGVSYTANFDAPLPHNIYGDYYIHILADGTNQVAEYTGEHNNTGAIQNVMTVTLRAPADLAVTAVNVAATANSGDNINLDWTVSNQGAQAPVESFWNDHIYISAQSTFDINNAVLLGNEYRLGGNQLGAGTSYNVATAVRIPDGYQGTYYLYIHADADEQVFEHTFEANNMLRSNAITVQLSASPDLTVTAIQAPDTIKAGLSFNLDWTVANQGAADLQAGRTDRIYYSKDPVWDYWTADGLANVSQADTIEAGQSASYTQQFILPVNVDEGPYYFFVHTDFNEEVYEHQADANNRTGTNDLGLIPTEFVRAYADLQVTAFTAPAQAQGGATVSLSWEVENKGEVFTNKSNWTDALYLSSDATWSSDDQLVDTYRRIGQLDTAASYRVDMTMPLPNGVDGNLHFIVRVDDDAWITNDTLPENNIAAAPVSIAPEPKIDLIAEALTVGASVYAGQQLSIPFSIRNQGTEDMHSGSIWKEKLYISNTPDLTGQPVSLDTYTQKTALAAGASYSEFFDVRIPAYLSGNYYLIVQADYRNDQYEQDEQNNLLVVPVEVLLANQADLTLSAIQMPQSAVPGDSITVTYTVQNQGTGMAVGSLRDALHLSQDTQYDALNDPLLGLKDIPLGPNALPAGASLNGSLKVAVPGIVPDNYHGILRTNTRNLVIETDITNNESVSGNSMQVSMNALQLGTSENNIDLDFQNQVYYQVSVGADLDLLLTMNSNQSIGNNEVYVAYNRVPTPYDYDYKHLQDKKTSQQVLIPETQAGVYYILLTTSDNFSGAQQVSLLAEALPFSILGITPAVVGQGRVTCTLNGAGFRDGIAIELRDKQGTVVSTAEVREHISSMQLKIRWYLDNVALGTYDVVAVNDDGTSTHLTDGLEVEVSTGFQVEVTDLIPDGIRSDQTGFFTYIITSKSNVDIPYLHAQVLMPDYAEILSINTSKGLLKLRDVVPASSNAFTPDYLIEEEEVQKRIPLFVKDMNPGDAEHCKIAVRNFPYNSFGMIMLTKPLTTFEFIQSKIAEINIQRLQVLADPSEFQALLNSMNTPPQELDSVLPLVNDSARYAREFLQMYIDWNLIEKEDLDEYNGILNFKFSRRSGRSFISETLPTIICNFPIPYLGPRRYGSPPKWKFPKGPPKCPGNDKPEKFDDCFSHYKDHCIRVVDVVCGIIGVIGVGAGVIVGTGAGGIGAIPGGIIGAIPGLQCKYCGTYLCEAEAYRKCLSIWNSCDPNEILGPTGVDTAGWVKEDTTLPYTIYFENDPELATVPAQQVTVRQPLDAEVDPYSFRLGNFGFGNLTFEVPDNSVNYHTVLKLVDTLGFDVEVTAGLDIINNEVFWVFQSIDPTTGLAPYDPFSGFLPINDSLGSGEGFVSYSIQPKAGVVTGDTISAQASIIFDINEAIETNTWFNTIDAGAPSSQVDALPATTNSTTFQVSWNGQDDGSGIGAYTLYVSDNGGPFQAYYTTGDTTCTTCSADSVLTAIDYTGVAGHSYAFFTITTDKVGHVEAMKQAADPQATISINAGSMVTITAPSAGRVFCAGDVVTVEWQASGMTAVDLAYAIDGGSHYVSVANGIAAAADQYDWTLPALASGSYRIRVVDAAQTGVEAISEVFTVHAAPAVSIDPVSSFCEGDLINLSVSTTATTCNWMVNDGSTVTPYTGASISFTAGAVNSYQVAVTCTDANGCSASDQITISNTLAVVNPIEAVCGDIYKDSTYLAGQRIITGDSCSITGLTRIQASTDVTFTAGQRITLSPGFETIDGAHFIAQIETICAPDPNAAKSEEVVAVEQAVELMEMELYPNPFNEVLNVRYELGQAQKVRIALYDLLGHQVARLADGIQQEKGEYELRFNTSYLKPGVYFITLETGHSATSKKLIKVKK